jgi:UDP-N-acetylglucosamine--N-acetylmuramyl-(pentapeptide) pyrophosphoryl-undecaprenol N-acetylglucosamine transferase
MRRKGLIKALLMPFQLLKAVWQARSKLKRLSPDVVLGMGGYASGPGGLAAYTLGIPIVLHEQNAVFGLTNRYLAKLAKKVLCGFDITKHAHLSKAPPDVIYVGNPVRSAFHQIAPISPRPSEKTHILIVGGSLGALALNEIVPAVLLDLSKRYSLEIWHQTGEGKLAPVKQAYSAVTDVKVTSFIDQMEAAYEWADIIICRAGALTVAEICAAGRLGIFVPLPSAVDDHQTLNAKNLVDQQAGMLIPQNRLKEKLAGELEHILKDKKQLVSMAQKALTLSQKHATDTVASHCISAASSWSKQSTESTHGSE